ncbi:MAG: hypothetical protein COW84_01100 [Gammaproteobacteria bacterium CG22_combo_CG10-13_8_21_14_all_40_8]|nr:MAG: hypothetical protein COW84_01100 [Gammaproteobacteria bacterium CG22_combo_CG10-13_8_21_14_all_40_8]
MFWQSAQDWLNQQSERDQKIIKIAAAFILLLLIYSFLFQPLTSGRSSLREQVQRAQQDLDFIKEGAAQLQQTHTQSGTSNLSSSQIVNATARKNSINVTRISPNRDNTQLVISIDEVEFTNLLKWANELQSQGLALDSLNINQGDHSGFIKASITVSQATAP